MNHPDEAPPDEDDDLVVMSTQGSDQFICPLTRKDLEDPLKKYEKIILAQWLTICSTKCGHYYSKAAILHHLSTSTKKRGKVACPVAGTISNLCFYGINVVLGCSSDVTKESLERDPEMERQLRRHIQRGGAQKKGPEEEEITNLDD